MVGSPNYHTEIVKGDGDKAIQVGYGVARINGVNVGKNEILKAYRIYSLAPESVFEGYLFARIDIKKVPNLIRLGSFRGVASLALDGPIRYQKEKRRYCDHPIDPLVSKVIRGVSVPMLPYPIVDQAMAEDVLEIKRHGQRAFVARVFDEESTQVEIERFSSSAII